MTAKTLIVDDEQDVISYPSALLGDAGHEVVAAKDGAEAMTRVAEILAR